MPAEIPTLAQVHEWAALAEKATDGPWEVFEGGNFVRLGVEGFIKDSDRRGYMGGPLSVAELEYAATEDHSHNHQTAMGNAEFMKASRTAIPALCATVERLVEALRDAHNRLYEDGPHSPWMDCDCPIAALLRELEGGKEKG